MFQADLTNESAHEKRVLNTDANQEGSDEPVHVPSLARAFIVCIHNMGHVK